MKPHRELKGKSISIPFFKPKDPQEVDFMAKHKILKPDQILLMHQNPMILVRDTNVNERSVTIGYE